jgi:hypothetical protein
MTAFTEIISEICGTLARSELIEVLEDPTMLLQLPNGNDGPPPNVDVLDYHRIRSSKIALDAVVSSVLGVLSPPSPEAAISAPW